MQCNALFMLASYNYSSFINAATWGLKWLGNFPGLQSCWKTIAELKPDLSEFKGLCSRTAGLTLTCKAFEVFTSVLKRQVWTK